MFTAAIPSEAIPFAVVDQVTVATWWQDGGWWITTMLAFAAAVASVLVVVQSYRDKPRVDWRLTVDGYNTWKTIRVWNIGDATATRVEGVALRGRVRGNGGGESDEFFFPRIGAGECMELRVAHEHLDEAEVRVNISYLTSPVRHRRWHTLRIDPNSEQFTLVKGRHVEIGSSAVVLSAAP